MPYSVAKPLLLWELELHTSCLSSCLSGRNLSEAANRSPVTGARGKAVAPRPWGGLGVGCAERRTRDNGEEPGWQVARHHLPRPGQASPSAGQGRSWCSDRVHGLCGDICCRRQSQIANSGFFLGDAGRASLRNSIISWRTLGPPLIFCQNGFLEKSLALERQNQRAQRHTMNTHHT